MSIKVENTIDVYEYNDDKIQLDKPQPELRVLSHWNRDEFVVLEVYGNRYTVGARELKAAIDNATNTSRY